MVISVSFPVVAGLHLRNVSVSAYTVVSDHQSATFCLFYRASLTVGTQSVVVAACTAGIVAHCDGSSARAGVRAAVVLVRACFRPASAGRDAIDAQP